VSYSDNNGLSWTLIDSGLVTTSTSWDTTTVADGTNYQFKVMASDSITLSTEAISGIFTVLNADHVLSEPTLLFPNGGEMLNSTVTIQWDISLDSKSHATLYSVYYSNDTGTTWNLLASNQTATSYTWNSSTVEDGDTYRIKVVVIDSFNAVMAEDTSDSDFSIINAAAGSEDLAGLIIVVLGGIFSVGAGGGLFIRRRRRQRRRRGGLI